MAFFNFISLKYNDLNKQVNDYVRNLYGKSSELFSTASPFGQILNVLKEFFQYTVLYQKNIVRNLDIDTVSNQKVIRLYSIIAGLNPVRSISSNGTLKFTLKPGVNITDEIKGSIIKMSDKTLLRNITNGLDYTIRFGRSNEIFRIKDGVSFYMNVVQGKYEEQTFTGNGMKNQIFTVNIPNIAEIDNFDVEVLYNGGGVTIKDSLYDLLRLERSCFIRTGMNGGIDVYFGNGSCGFIPEIGSIITVRYLLTDGINGNILTPIDNDFKFLSEVTDNDGNTINMTNLFNIIPTDGFNFGSYGESGYALRSRLSNISRNFVLSTPSQYIFHLRRLGFFSKINVYNTLSDNDYTNDNVIYLFLIPNISNYYSNSVNYFNLPIDIYTLDNYEIDKVISYLKRLGNIPNGTELEVIQPVISKYVMFIYVRKYEGSNDETIKSDIISRVSDYLTQLDRDDRIVRSDVISIIENVDGVDGVNVSFTSEKNETLHRLKPNSTDIVGLDPTLGDIVLEKTELGLIRGGWTDRNGTYYNENVNGSGLGPINIIFVGTTKKTN